MTIRSVHLKYFALIRDLAGKDTETLITDAKDIAQLYQVVKEKYQLPYPIDQIKAACNLSYIPSHYQFSDRDEIAFIPPVGGG